MRAKNEAKTATMLFEDNKKREKCCLQTTKVELILNQTFGFHPHHAKGFQHPLGERFLRIPVFEVDAQSQFFGNWYFVGLYELDQRTVRIFNVGKLTRGIAHIRSEEHTSEL